MSDQVSDVGLELLLKSMLQEQQSMASELRDIVKTMVTKDDIQNLTVAMGNTVTRSELALLSDELEKQDKRLRDIEKNQMPSWFWPLLTGLLAVIVPIFTMIVTHFWGGAKGG